MKYEIEIEGLPEGWEAVAYRYAAKGEYVLFKGDIISVGSDKLVERLIVEKIQPRRIVLEETRELAFPEYNTHIIRSDTDTRITLESKYLWREVK